jgi:flagellar basal body-associated protein FliL
MRLIIVGFLVLILLGVGGYMGYMYFAKSMPPAAVIAQIQGKPYPPEAKEETPPPEAIVEEAVFLKMPVLNVSVFNQGEVSRLVGIQVVLEFPKEASKSHAETIMPALKDAMLTRLYHLARLNMLPTEGTALFLKRNILDVAQSLLGVDNVATATVYATNDNAQ